MAIDREASSVELLARWHAGDEAALGRLVAQNRPWLWRYARARMSDRLRGFATSEDIIQEALLQLLRYGPSFSAENDAQFRALIAKMVLNRIRDLADYAGAARRDKSREARANTSVVSHIGPAERSSLQPDRLVAAAEETNLVRLALQLLEPEEKRIIESHRFEGRSFGEIGQSLGIQPKTANKRFSRAVARLGLTLRRLENAELDEWIEEVRPFEVENDG